MLFTLALASAGVLGRALSSRAASERRARWVEHHPGEAEYADVAHLLRSGGVSRRDVNLVADTSVRLGLRPFTLWMFGRTYGARGLAVAVAAELTHDDLLEALAGGQAPDFAELEVFASFHGLQATQHPARAGSPADRSPEPLSSFEVPSDEPVRDWDFGFDHRP